MMANTFVLSTIYNAGETAAALAVVALFLPREALMTKEDFAEAVHRLAGYYADEGPGRKTMLAEIESMAEAMRLCVEE